MLKTFFLPVGLLASSIIGAGAFALPYVFVRAGLSLGLLYLLLGGVAYTVVHLMYADIIIRTKEAHRFPGYARQYLGNPGFWLAIGIGILEMILVLTIYLILSKSFGQLVGPAWSDTRQVVVFWILGSLTLLVGVSKMTKLEAVISVGIVGIILMVFLLGLGAPTRIAESGWLPMLPFAFLPLAPVLFSFSGRVAIPSLVKYARLANHGRIDKAVRRAVVWGTFLPAVLYAFLVLGIVGLSPIVTEDAVGGIVGQVSPSVLIVLGVLGLITLWSSYIIVAYDVNGILEEDFKLPRSSRFVLVVLAPLVLYLLGFQDFLKLVGFVGGIFLALEGLLIIFMWRRANRVLKSSSILMRGVGPGLILLTTLVFVGAFAYQIWGR